jgi:hypothetical protein
MWHNIYYWMESSGTQNINVITTIFTFICDLDIFPLISLCDIVSIISFDLTVWYCQYHFLWSQCDIVSIISFDLTVWYCQYYILWSHCVILSVFFPLISLCDIVSIISFDLSVILSVLFPLISQCDIVSIISFDLTVWYCHCQLIDYDTGKYRSVWSHIMKFNTDRKNNICFEG